MSDDYDPERYSFTEGDLRVATATYAEHVTGYSMRDGGRTFACRCGWRSSADDAQQKALNHRMREALASIGDSHNPYATDRTIGHEES